MLKLNKPQKTTPKPTTSNTSTQEPLMDTEVEIHDLSWSLDFDKFPRDSWGNFLSK